MWKRMQPMWITLISLALAALATPLAAQGYGRGYYNDVNALRFRLGLFEPDGGSAYWNDNKLTFSGDASDFDDVIVGVDYERKLSQRLGVLFSASGYEGNADQFYLDFVDASGNDIVHRTTLEIDTLTAGFRYQFLPGRILNPYVGAGGGAYFWRLQERGDFIDFGVVPEEIFRGRFKDDGVTLGWFWMAGAEIRLTPSWSFFGEARWHRADDDLSGDFQGLGKLDLSGREVSGGVTWKF